MLELFEKLINEHGSSAILKERLGFLQAQYAALEARCRDLESKNAAQQAELDKYRREADAPRYVAGKQVFCQHCGSPRLTRTGSKPDRVFGDLGVDRILFRCDDCGEDSDFLNA